MAVTAYSQKAGLEQSEKQRRDALLIELDRRDAPQAAQWDKAMNGDLRAAVLVLRLVEQRVRLLGLDRLGAEPAQGSVYSLVIDDR